MAQGDSADMQARITTALPTGWFADDAPVLGGLLSGLASAWAWLFSLLAFARQQDRLATASSGWLDLFARDYGGGAWARQIGETDDGFRARIGRNLQRLRATRAALAAAVTDLTGRAPVIFEPARPTDTGVLNGPGLAWNTAGGWGTLTLPFQCFVTAFRPAGGGIANSAGYGGEGVAGALGGWGAGALQWGSTALIAGAVTDVDILAVVADAMPVATIAWTRISN
jgi:hypothetical protein